jgi:flavin reductase (DIM6/NTAB) family NADH-FMN oxidoreductase RutF
VTKRIAPAGSTFSLADALTAWAAGVTLITIADGRDDIGTTVSAFCPVSADPPLVAVALIAGSYPAEVLGRDDPERPGTFAVTLLGSAQRALAGRFAAAGRPGARLLLDSVPHHRGELSGALIPDDGLAALECAVTQRIPAGDHLLLIAEVLAVPHVAPRGAPLIRFRGSYPALAAGDQNESGLGHDIAKPD